MACQGLIELKEAKDHLVKMDAMALLEDRYEEDWNSFEGPHINSAKIRMYYSLTHSAHSADGRFVGLCAMLWHGVQLSFFLANQIA